MLVASAREHVCVGAKQRTGEALAGESHRSCNHSHTQTISTPAPSTEVQDTYQQRPIDTVNMKCGLQCVLPCVFVGQEVLGCTALANL